MTTYRGIIKDLTPTGAMVEIPTIGIGALYGPCQVMGRDYELEQTVVVTTIAGVKEDLVVLGPYNNDSYETYADGGDITDPDPVDEGGFVPDGVAMLPVKTNDLKDGLITSGKLADGSVINSKLATNSVTNTKLANSAVNNAKIADGSIGSNKVKHSLGFNAVTDPGFQNSAINAQRTSSISSLSNGRFVISEPNSVRFWLIGETVTSNSTNPASSAGFTPATPGETWNASYWVNSVITRPCRIQLAFVGSDGTLSGNTYATPTTNSAAAGVDTKVEFTFTVNSTVSSGARVIGFVAAVVFDGGQTAGQSASIWEPRIYPQDTQALSAINTLTTTVGTKAADNAVVKLTGNQTIAGTKTFSSAPSVPNNSFSIAAINGLQAAIDGKQATLRVASGSVSDITLDTGFSIQYCYLYRVGAIGYIGMQLTNLNTISVSSNSGNFSNILVGTIKSSSEFSHLVSGPSAGGYSSVAYSLATSSDGIISSGYINASGAIYVSATIPTSSGSFSAGLNISLSGTFMLDNSTG